jgi:hypothetical protein
MAWRSASVDLWWSATVRKLLDILCSPQATETVTDVEGRDVVVMTSVDSRRLHEPVRWMCDSSDLSRRIFHSTHHLQRLQLKVDAISHRMPSIDTLRLLAHLRHLRVEHYDCDESHPEESLLNFRAALDVLSQLTSVHSIGLHVGIADVLHIAAHSTLDDVVVAAQDGDVAYLDRYWLGDSVKSFHFPSEGDDVSADEDNSDEDAEEEEVKDAEEAEEEDALATEHRLRAALSRTQPTLRSVQTRLALVELLQSRINRHSLRSGCLRPLSLLAHYRRFAELVRSSLQWQCERLLSADGLGAVSTPSVPSST